MGKRKRRSTAVEADILVIGGGLAGLAAAVACSSRPGERRLRVHLVGGGRGGAPGPLVLFSPEAQREARGLLGDRMPDGWAVESDQALWAGPRRWRRLPWKGSGPRRDHRVYDRDRLLAALEATAREQGVETHPGARALSLLFRGERVVGAVVGSAAGLRRDPLRAAGTCIADGSAGSLSRALFDAARLGEGKGAPTWGGLIEETWRRSERQPGSGQVLRSFGWPAPRGLFGGGVVIEGADRVTVRFLVEVGPRAAGIDPWALHGRWRRHPVVAGRLEGAELLARRAGLLPLGGYWSLPRLAAAGAVLAGSAGGLFDPGRWKGPTWPCSPARGRAVP
ncbi:MAG: FAD-binding protein [Acidobacteriota bacterium]|nr:FAD-binding protein [Acidobacteriota bacterium]